MRILNKKVIEKSLDSSKPGSLFIDPLLDREQQIHNISIDLRLGYDFQVAIQTRRPSIDPSERSDARRAISTYFQETRRELGDRFAVYPSQVVVATTLEYISLPNNVYADVISRSSYARLGLHINTMLEPGWRGCVSIELCNQGNTPIELVVGSRIVQARLVEVDSSSTYQRQTEPRKYHGTVRPIVSRADRDEDLEKLAAMRQR